jgi:hypothetical protein
MHHSTHMNETITSKKIALQLNIVKLKNYKGIVHASSQEDT